MLHFCLVYELYILFGFVPQVFSLSAGLSLQVKSYCLLAFVSIRRKFYSIMEDEEVVNIVSMRPLVNGTNMQKYIGRTVTLVGSVISVNPKGTSFDLKTPDLQIVIVSMRKPLTEPVTGLVEVHGIVQGRNSMVCDYYMILTSSLADSYDQELTNKVLTLMHTLPNAWVESA